MAELIDFMQADHRACDEYLVAVEAAAERGDWPQAARAVRSFRDAIALHLAREEEILFPAFEAATGQNEGPTAVMRAEHGQARSMLEQLTAAAAAEDGDQCLGVADTLMVLLQQHNMKEEQVLYPMVEGVLADAGEVLAKMRDLEHVAD